MHGEQFIVPHIWLRKTPARTCILYLNSVTTVGRRFTQSALWHWTWNKLSSYIVWTLYRSCCLPVSNGTSCYVQYSLREVNHVPTSGIHWQSIVWLPLNLVSDFIWKSMLETKLGLVSFNSQCWRLCDNAQPWFAVYHTQRRFYVIRFELRY